MNNSVDSKRRFLIVLAIVFPLVGLFAAAVCGLALFVRVQLVRVPAEAPEDVEWHDYSPESNAFTLSFPGIPKTHSQRLPEGPELVHTAVFEDGNRVFKITWQHISPTDSQIEPMLQSAVSQLLKKLKAYDVATSSLEPSTISALECVGTGIGGNGRRVNFRCRLVYSNETVYTLVWLGTTRSTASSSRDRFFESFKCDE